jgi:hypothetical protein
MCPDGVFDGEEKDDVKPEAIERESQNSLMSTIGVIGP